MPRAQQAKRLRPLTTNRLLDFVSFPRISKPKTIVWTELGESERLPAVPTTNDSQYPSPLARGPPASARATAAWVQVGEWGQGPRDATEAPPSALTHTFGF